MIASLVEPKYPLESLHWKIKCTGLLCQQHLIEHLVVLQLFIKKDQLTYVFIYYTQQWLQTLRDR